MSDSTILSDRQLQEQVIELVTSFRMQVPTNASISDIVDRFGLSIHEGELPAGKDGAYIENESKIIVNSLITSEERKLFTVYHELVHYLIRNDSDLYSYLHEAYQDSRDFEKTIELICNIGAAEFILPRENVRDLIEKEGFSLNLIPTICQDNCVSGQAAMIQLIQCAPHCCYGVICGFGIPPLTRSNNQTAFVPANNIETLYVLYAMWSPSAKYSIARFTPIPKDHMLFNALSNHNLISGRGRIPFRSGTNWIVPCEVLNIRNSIYGIFNVKPPLNYLHPRLF